MRRLISSCVLSFSLILMLFAPAGCGSSGTTSDEDYTDPNWNPFDSGTQDLGNTDTAGVDAATDAPPDVPCVLPCGENCCGEGELCLEGNVCCKPNCDDKCVGGSDGCGNICTKVPECTGCCTDDKVCKPGTFNDFCGKAGLACQTCAAPLTCQGQICSNSPCTPQCDDKCAGAADGCGGLCAENKCTGCCQDQVTGPICLFGNTQDACGKDGAPCQVCSGGSLCAGGLCGCTPDCTGKCQGADNGCGSACTTSDCNGCCAADFSCQPGTSIAACGKVGGTCASCGPDQSCKERTCTDIPCEKQCTGKQCGDDGCGGTCGTCGANQKCMPDGTCCTPSCDGKCQSASDGCGGTCSNNAPCVGCCDAQGTCLAGTTNAACGLNGQTCAACVSPELCQNNTCQEPCVPDCTGKCPTGPDGCGGTCSPNPPCDGCCDVNGTCMGGTSAVACGKSGAACKVCIAGEQCLDQQCKTVCTPNCANKCPTASDGCGGTCSSNPACEGCCSNGFCMPGTWTDMCGKSGQDCKVCTTGQSCLNQVCTTTCTPNCTLKCNGESDGCGGFCPTCPSGYSCVSGVCEEDTTSDCASTPSSNHTPLAALLIVAGILISLGFRRRSKNL